jgi:hypothetical protein
MKKKLNVSLLVCILLVSLSLVVDVFCAEEVKTVQCRIASPRQTVLGAFFCGKRNDVLKRTLTCKRSVFFSRFSDLYLKNFISNKYYLEDNQNKDAQENAFATMRTFVEQYHSQTLVGKYDLKNIKFELLNNDIFELSNNAIHEDEFDSNIDKIMLVYNNQQKPSLWKIVLGRFDSKEIRYAYLSDAMSRAEKKEYLDKKNIILNYLPSDDVKINTDKIKEELSEHTGQMMLTQEELNRITILMSGNQDFATYNMPEPAGDGNKKRYSNQDDECRIIYDNKILIACYDKNGTLSNNKAYERGDIHDDDYPKDIQGEDQKIEYCKKLNICSANVVTLVSNMQRVIVNTIPIPEKITSRPYKRGWFDLSNLFSAGVFLGSVVVMFNNWRENKLFSGSSLGALMGCIGGIVGGMYYSPQAAMVGAGCAIAGVVPGLGYKAIALVASSGISCGFAWEDDEDTSWKKYLNFKHPEANKQQDFVHIYNKELAENIAQKSKNIEEQWSNNDAYFAPDSQKPIWVPAVITLGCSMVWWGWKHGWFDAAQGDTSTTVADIVTIFNNPLAGKLLTLGKDVINQSALKSSIKEVGSHALATLCAGFVGMSVINGIGYHHMTQAIIAEHEQKLFKDNKDARLSEKKAKDDKPGWFSSLWHRLSGAKNS